MVRKSDIDSTQSAFFLVQYEYFLINNILVIMSGRSMKRLLERCSWAQLRRFSSQTGDVHNGLLEMREYTIDPGSYAKFLSLVEETADLRKSVLPVVGYV